jgi:hypothetical protein
MAMQLVKVFASKKDELGNVHWEPGDEARFYRCVAMAGKYAEARAPFESPYASVDAAVGPLVDPSQMMMNAKELPTVEFVDYTFVFH